MFRPPVCLELGINDQEPLSAHASNARVGQMTSITSVSYEFRERSTATFYSSLINSKKSKERRIFNHTAVESGPRPVLVLGTLIIMYIFSRIAHIWRS